jgi:esterase/lipase
LKIYGISGLGADKRVFNFLKIDCEFIPIDWIKPIKNESIENYSKRLSKVIETDSDFGILGVSFGGLIAVEISKFLNPKLTILISSAETKNELRAIYKLFGKTNIIKLIPNQLFNPPRIAAHYLFGADNKKLLNEILDDTDLQFAKWAVSKLITWKNQKQITPILKISGTKDKLITPSSDKKTILIEGGKHFMIVDKANEISKIINTHLSNYRTDFQS